MIILITSTSALSLDAFPPDYTKRRLIISTDIGGGDADDIQSMIHFLAYANMFDLEGIVISRPRGHVDAMYKVINAYARDYRKFQFVSPDYPSPSKLRSLVKIGASRQSYGPTYEGQSHIDRWKSSRPRTPKAGYSTPTAGSRLIISAANKIDPRPLYVLCWGSATDVAQAVHDDPKIIKKLIVITGGTGSDMYNYLLDPTPQDYLRKIKRLKHIDGAYGRGLYKGGLHNKTKYGNIGFVLQVVKPRGHLGKLFYEISRPINVNRYGIKMGDTTTLFFVMNGDINRPQKPSWGGRFCSIPGTNRSVWCDRYGDNSVSIHRKDFLVDWENRLKMIYDR